ncbi:hydantoinase B/oxoprolinase family protein [Burkholderia cenocepacia]|uniref:Hydantoinase B/oxoprolinase family protein n=1 Tax=Burkholderia cenocepacia TaxID=95486 RepID=A0AAN0RZF1_9BURK|nr:hydantoinase B/oxoprolinase family protein [Burkholderia cenocepacia]
MIPGSENFVGRPVDPETLLRTVAGKVPVHTVSQEVIDDLDPLTYEVVRHRLWSVTDEMGETLKRMSGSPIVTDCNDFDFTVNDEMGQLVQVGLYNTMLVGAIDLALAWTLQNRADNPGIEEGDMFLCNDPWIGGGLHQNDVLVYQPIFYDGKLFAWTTAICHEPDLGGSAIGSMPIGNVDVFHESIPTPPIRIVRNSEIQRDVLDAWTRRSRVPMIIGLDLRAKVGANNIGRKRLIAVIEQYGPDVVKAVMKRMMNDAESRLRDKLRSAPDGEWSVSSHQDQAYLGDRETHRVALKMTKNGGHLTFDFTGTDPQAGVISCTFGGCRGGVMLAFLPMLAGDIPWSAGGLMRCFDIIAPEGTLANATFPAALCRAPLATGWVIGNLVAQCLSQMLGRSFELRRNVQASCCGTFDCACIAGVDERSEQPVPFINVVMEGLGGGYGARPNSDGISTGGNFCIPMGRMPDVEVTEMLYPLLMLWRREEVDSGGAGRQRGGASAAVAMTPHGTSLPAHVVMSSSGKATAQNPGLAGGYPGNLGYDVVVHGARLMDSFAAGKLPSSLDEIEGDANPTQCYAQTIIEPGDLLYLNCQGGGGYGDPLHRDADAVEEDVRNGVVSAAAARDIYGVILDENGNVKEVETEERRQEIRDGRREKAYLGTILKQRVTVGEGMLIDDNLVSHIADDKAVIACRHCGQVVGDNENRLHLARLNGSSDLAGPSVRATPDYYIDAPVHFEQMLCPSCFTVMHTALTVTGERQTVSGFALAR